MLALGIVLLLAGLALVLVEAHLTIGGILGALGGVSAVVGVGLLVRSAGLSPWLSALVAILVGVGAGCAGVVVMSRVAATTHGEVRSGPPRLVGSAATVRTWAGGSGIVMADGALWNARWSAGWETGAAPAAGDRVVIESLDGLTLSVRPRHVWELEAG